MPARVIRPRAEDELKLELLRAHIELGVMAADWGDHVELQDEDLERYIDRLLPPKPRRRARPRK